jgi:hypothetical protein
MRYEYDDTQWVELADDLELSAGEMRQVVRYNEFLTSDEDTERLIASVMPRAIVNHHLLDIRKQPVNGLETMDEYMALPRRTWFWLLGKVFEAASGNPNTSESE